jgi:serine protease Do
LARKAGPTENDDPRNKKPTLHHYGTLIQTDAKLNLGSSGGALLNLKGEMIGLTTSLAAISGYEQSAGFAIPVDDAFRQFVEKLKTGRGIDFGFLGVDPRNLTAEEAQQGIQGVRITTVSPGTPAARADLRQGDVITHINGEPVYDADGLRLQVARLAPMAEATLMVERGLGQASRQTVIKRAVLSKAPLLGKRIVTANDPAWRGLRVEFPTAFFPPLPLDESPAVAVEEVAEGTPAFKSGLRRGMMITYVENTAVETPDEFRRQVGGKQGPVSLRIAGRPGDLGLVTVEAK